MHISIQEYSPKDIKSLHQAFLAAFADYFVNFQPDAAQFDQRIRNKINVQSEYSRVAWADGALVGFVLNTIGRYQDKQTLYNGGTGVIPDYQNQKIATRLYLDLLRKLDKSVERIVLEVVEGNAKAIKLYESLGFHFLRVLRCFKLKSHLEPKSDIAIKPTTEWKDNYANHLSVQPAFLDDCQQLKTVIRHEQILEAYNGEELIGHLIYQPQNLRISQLAVNPAFRGIGVAASLLAHAQKISGKTEFTLMNIDESATSTILALQKLGFQNELNQLELEMPL